MTVSRSPERIAPILLALVALTIPTTANGQTSSTWNGSTGNWTDVARWNTPHFPNNGNGGLDYTATIGGGNVTLNQNITLDGFTMTGGNLLAVGAGGPFTLTVKNNLLWTGGAIGGGQTMISNGVASVPNVLTLGGTFTNAGQATVNALSGSAASVVNNAIGATFTHTGALLGTGTFNNFGTYNASNGFRGFEWTFNNKAGGIVNLTNATIQSTGNGVHDGTFNLSNSALQFEAGTSHTFGQQSQIIGINNSILRVFGSSVTISGGFTTTGQTWVTSGSLTFNSAFTATGELRVDQPGFVNFNVPTSIGDFWLNGTLGGSAAVTFAGPFDFEGSATLGGTSPQPHRNIGITTMNNGGYKTFAHSFVNENGATVQFNGGDAHIAAGVTVTNKTGALFLHQSNGDIGKASQPNGDFVNSGTFSRRIATGTADIYSRFSNAPGALVDVQTGTLNLANPGKLAGTFNIASGATLAFSGVQTLPSSMAFTGAGTIAAAGGVTTIATTLTYPNFALTGGTLAGNGALAVSTLTFSGGTIGRHLDLKASASNVFTGGTLTIGSGSKFSILGGATLQASAGTITGASGNLNNLGTLNKTGAGTLIIGAPFRNFSTGRLAIQAGTVQIDRPDLLSGTFDLVGAGTVLALNGNSTLTSQAAFIGPGIVQATAGTTTLSGSVTIPNFTFSGGTLAGTGTLSATNLVLSGGTIGRDFILGGTASNQFTGGTLTVGSGFTMTVPAGRTLTAATGTIAGPGMLANLGTITKTGATTLTINAPFANQPGGMVQVQGGTLSLTGGGTQAGSFGLSNGTTLSLGAGAAIGSAAQIGGAGQIQVNAANVSFAGAGNHTYTGGTVIATGASAVATGTGAAFGAANVTVNGSGELRLSAVANLAPGTSAVVTSNATLGLEGSFDPAPIVHSTSSGIVAINIPNFSTSLNQAAIGNGSMFLGSSGSGSYGAATLGPGAGNTYRLGAGTGTLAFGGTNVLTGNAAATIGSGANATVAINGPNNYTGATTLAAGTLIAGNNAALGTGTLILNGGTLQASGGPIAFANPVTLGGNVNLAGSDELTFTGSVTLTGNRTVTVAGSATISGDISGDTGSRSLLKAGPGTLTLSGTNSYAGGTFINGGTVRAIGTNQALGQGTVFVNSGTSLRQASFNNLGAGATVTVLAGGVLGLDGNFPPILDPVSSGIVALNIANYSQPVNLSTMGNGQMFLGSQTNGAYTAATLGAGTASIYRLGGGGGTLTIPTANLLTGFTGLLVGSTQANGAGTVVFSAAQSYQGNTSINSGSTLVLQAPMTGQGNVIILPGGTLAGVGPVGGSVTVNGALAPGSTAGTMTLNNGVNFSSGGKYTWDLAALTTGGGGTQWDQVNITGGNLSINPAAVFEPRFSGTATAPDVNDPFWHSAPELTWRIISLSGSATNTGGSIFQINNSAWAQIGAFTTRAGAGGVDLVWTHAPEPVHALLIAACAGAVAFIRRKRAFHQNPPVATGGLDGE